MLSKSARLLCFSDNGPTRGVDRPLHHSVHHQCTYHIKISTTCVMLHWDYVYVSWLSYQDGEGVPRDRRDRQDGCQAWNHCFRSLSLPVSNDKTRRFERPSGHFVAFFVAAKQGILVRCCQENFPAVFVGTKRVFSAKTWPSPNSDQVFLFVPKPYQHVHIQCQHLFWRRSRTQTTYDWLHNAVSLPISIQTKYSDWDFSRVLFGFVGAGWVIVWMVDSICDVPAGRYDLPPSGQWRVWPSCHSVKE